jgi:rifampicin phosphotransferase
VSEPSDGLPQIVSLDESFDRTSDRPVGGKAEGLSQLVRMGLPVPPAFVILDAQADVFPANLLNHYQRIGGGRVAVRSSALGEDGEETSFAGQFDTFLNVEGEAELRQAIGDCVASLSGREARAYGHERGRAGPESMCVVVQAMVDPQAAGVLFSADPVSGRHDRLVVDAVRGLGESLVSGDVTPDHYVLDLENAVVSQELVAKESTLTHEQLCSLALGARKAAEGLGKPVDMEWAIDGEGAIQWLQARPITTLGGDLNADFTPISRSDVITRCNVGEMMPGPVCPLTFSTQGRAIEHGMQHMQVCYGGRPAITSEWTQINLFFGHMFINLTGGLEASRFVSITSAETLGQSVCGRVIPELHDPPNKRNLPRRILGTLQFIRYCLRATKTIAEFDSRFRHFHLRYCDDSLGMVEEMERKFPWLLEADEVHLRSSAYSGLMEGVVQGVVVSRDSDSDSDRGAAQQAEAARLLAGASHVESAMMVEQLDEVVDTIAQDRVQAEKFRSASAEEALGWLQASDSGAAGIGFRSFLRHHGHRGYRELCVREKAWADEPEQVVRTMQASITARIAGGYQPKKVAPVSISKLGLALRFLVPRAHLAIRQREQTKSMLVDATYRLKCGYRYLGVLLEREGALPDADLVFFLSREELSEFCRRPTADWVDRMVLRRRALDFQQKLEFDDVYVGSAEPREAATPIATAAGEYVGRPVSRGVVEGRARVATTLDEAASLEPGEILISHITDIGWTPYFSLIAGLATDVGSAVSHGAVIAREYGLPAIVNLGVVTRVVGTGDWVRLDADKGLLTVVEVAEEKGQAGPRASSEGARDF